jgi:hypothetical protein
LEISAKQLSGISDPLMELKSPPEKPPFQMV